VTTIVHLVRHAAHGLVNSTLCGRMPGVRLGPEGQAQAWSLAGRFSREAIDVVYTSPLERARETAEPLAETIGSPPRVSEALTEIEYGDWTGRSFAELEGDPHWAAWNSARGVNRPPCGESMLEAQARAVGEIERVRGEHVDMTAVLVSHADVIKAVLLHALGLSVDSYHRIEISPASVSTLAIGDWGCKVLRMNEAGA
jgi:broad specificity phosphatase PhoE